MSLETDSGSAEVSGSVSGESAAESSESSSSSKSNSGYSVTDPGYDSGLSGSDDEGSDLESLIAENKSKAEKPAKAEKPTKQPSEKSDDASDAENEGETEEEAETESPAEAATPNGISDELLDRAVELGYTIAEIKGFRSEKSLEKEVARVEQLQKRMQARQAGKTPANDESKAEDSEPEPNWEEMVEAGHDPDIVAMQKKMWERATKAEALVKQVYQSEQDRAWTAQCERFDDSLNKLGEEYKTILGSGRRGELLKTSPEQAANRATVFEKMLVLKNGYAQAGKKIPSDDDLIQEAVQASFWKQTHTIARDQLKREIKKIGSQALSRPHSSGNRPLTGQALATAKEAEFWKKHS